MVVTWRFTSNIVAWLWLNEIVHRCSQPFNRLCLLDLQFNLQLNRVCCLVQQRLIIRCGELLIWWQQSFGDHMVQIRCLNLLRWPPSHHDRTEIFSRWCTPVRRRCLNIFRYIPWLSCQESINGGKTILRHINRTIMWCCVIRLWCQARFEIGRRCWNRLSCFQIEIVQLIINNSGIPLTEMPVFVKVIRFTSNSLQACHHGSRLIKVVRISGVIIRKTWRNLWPIRFKPNHLTIDLINTCLCSAAVWVEIIYMTCNCNVLTFYLMTRFVKVLQDVIRVNQPSYGLTIFTCERISLRLCVKLVITCHWRNLRHCRRCCYGWQRRFVCLLRNHRRRFVSWALFIRRRYHLLGRSFNSG